MSWTSGAAKPVAMSMNDYRRLSDFDLKALEGKSDSTLGRKSVGEAEGLMVSEAGDDSGVGGVQLLPAKDVLQKVVAASAAGDSQELHKWEGRLDELLEGQTEAMCAFILGAFGRVHEPAKDATGTMDVAMPPPPPHRAWSREGVHRRTLRRNAEPQTERSWRGEGVLLASAASRRNLRPVCLRCAHNCGGAL